MAGKDLGCKILLDIDEVFADVFNVCLFKGKELIKPEAPKKVLISRYITGTEL